MKPKILKNEKEHQAALARVDKLMDAEAGSRQEEELELWSLLVEEYEKKTWPIDPPDPVEAIRFRMDQMGLQQKDLTRFIPAKSKVSEVMNRKRPLSLAMIRALHKNLGIPAEVLVQETKVSYGNPTAAQKANKKTEAASKKGGSRR
jgi:HTH-type transcriptional regulator / antitoxin HigA